MNDPTSAMNPTQRPEPHHFHEHFRVPLTSSVRARLTLWYLAVMAVIVVVFGGSLYATQTFLNADAAESRLEAQLYQDSQQFAQTYKQALLNQQTLKNLPLDASAQEMVVLLRPDGSVLDARGPLTSSVMQQLQSKAGQSAGMTDVTIPQTQAQSHTHGWWGGGNGWWSGGNTYRVLITPVLSQNARVATLVVGLQRQDTIPLFAIWLFWGSAALLVAAIGGYWLAGKVLQPVKMITRTANEINATDLRRRLHLQRRDEFGELAATFDRMLARLEAAFKRQAQFTADASHELRTPLTVMNLEINRALTQVEQPEDYRQVLEQVQAENEQLIAMVNGLLLLARADTGQMTMEWQEVDLSDIALACVERLLPLAQRSHITLATGDLPEVLVRGDPRYLGQMLTNLIENGIKYSSGIGKRVHVELASEQDRWAVVRVRDDGPGISEEHLPYLFERFYRVDKARSHRRAEPGKSNGTEDEESGGTGLGLSIVQWIVQAHGGELRVESASGAGSLFEVYLPLLHSAQAWNNEEPIANAPDDKSMTKPSGNIHDAVISASYTVPAPLSSINSNSSHSKGVLMSQIPLRQQASTFIAFRVIVVCQAIVFFLAAALHTGVFGVPSLPPAMIVEGLCGIGCVISAYGIFTRKTWAPGAAVIIQILILLAVLLGVFVILSSPDIRTALNLALHAIMLALIVPGLALLAIPGTRAALRSDHAA